MGRPKLHSSPAEKQAAYRSRLDATKVVVDKSALDNLHGRLEQLHTVIESAAREGNPFARRCRAGSIDTMLDNLIAVFSEETSPPGARIS